MYWLRRESGGGNVVGREQSVQPRALTQAPHLAPTPGTKPGTPGTPGAPEAPALHPDVAGRTFRPAHPSSRPLRAGSPNSGSSRHRPPLAAAESCLGSQCRETRQSHRFHRAYQRQQRMLGRSWRRRRDWHDPQPQRGGGRRDAEKTGRSRVTLSAESGMDHSGFPVGAVPPSGLILLPSA